MVPPAGISSITFVGIITGINRSKGVMNVSRYTINNKDHTRTMLRISTVYLVFAAVFLKESGMNNIKQY